MYPTAEEPWFGSFVKEQVDDLEGLGVQTDVFSFDGRRHASNYFRAMETLRTRVRELRYDVIHAHYGLSGAVAMVQREAPIITTFHGSDTGYYKWQRAVSWVVARATQPLFVTTQGRLLLGIADAPVVPMGVDLDFFQPIDRAEARQRLGWNPEKIYVLFPGARRVRRKNAALFDAVMNAARRRFAPIAAVSLEGFSRDEVALVMNAVSAVVMTSHFEGSPVAVKEALACLTPVVSVPVGDNPDVLAGLPGCAVAPYDADALARALFEAIRPDRNLALRRRAAEYSRARVARAVLDLYSKVAR
jgi:glycosyltransferase involved in cell wall biosynthesis